MAKGFFQFSLQLRFIGLAALVGIVFSVVFTEFMTIHIQEDAYFEFERDSNERFLAIKNDLLRTLNSLEDISSFYAGSSFVSQEEFGKFAQPLLLRNKGIRVLAWVPRVSNLQRAAREAAENKNYPGFRITEYDAQGRMVPAKRRDEYFPVFYLEPYQGNESALDFDLAAKAMFHRRLILVGDTGEAAVIRGNILSHQSGVSSSFSILHPIYRNNMTVSTVAERREHLLGFVLGVCQVHDLIKTSIAPLVPRGVKFWIHDTTTPGESQFLYFHDSRLAVGSHSQMGTHGLKESLIPENTQHITQTFQFGSQQWLFTFMPDDADGRLNAHFNPMWIFIFGSLLTALITTFLLYQHKNILRQQYMVAKHQKIADKNVSLIQSKEAVNQLLQSALRGLSLHKQLSMALRLIREGSGILLENKSALFLIDEASGDLVLTASENLPEPLQVLCERIRPGYCLCGRVAENRKLLFVGTMDEHHDITYEGILPHGHYCVPILFHEQILGVITLYTGEGHTHHIEEEEFLLAMANALAGIITRYQSEQTLRERNAQLIHVGRLSAMGEMATGMAHEINQPLTIIRTWAENQKNALGKGDIAKQQLLIISETIIKNVDRASLVIQHMRGFARQESSNPPTSVDLLVPVHGAISFFQEQFRMHEIELDLQIENDIPKVIIDPNRFEQIVVNLLSNARYAVDKKEPADEMFNKMIRVDLSYDHDKKDIVMEVEDNGIGMSSLEKDQCLEPFFSTKEVGQGTGLGLHIVRDIIVNELHGTIHVDSSLGVGTRFEIRFPVTFVKEDRL